MIELPLNPRRFNRIAKRFGLMMLVQMLVPRRIWQGGWLLQVWSSKERRWKRCTLDTGYFRSNERREAHSWLSDRRKQYPHRRFRLQRINGQDFYQDLFGILTLWDGYGSCGRVEGSPLWRMLGRKSV